MTAAGTAARAAPFSVPIPFSVPMDPLSGRIRTEDAIRTENHPAAIGAVFDTDAGRDD
jgi:hypothetical protein